MGARFPRTRFLLLLPVVLSMLAGPEVGAQELVTDRPDQTESAVVVPVGLWQLETGWTFTRDDEDGVRTESHEAPGTLVRIGVAERWELRVGWSGFAEVDVESATERGEVDGVLDAELGAKVLLRQSEAEGGWQAALLFGASLPVGDRQTTSDRVDPALRFSLAHDLGQRWSAGYNLGVAWETTGDGSGGRRSPAFGIYSVAFGYGATDRLGLFVEAFGEVGDGSPAHSVDGGVTWRVGPRTQLDLAVGLGLSDAADDAFVGLGASWRWPR